MAKDAKRTALSARPDGDLDALEGAVAGAPGSDLQSPLSRERREIDGDFEVSPGVTPIVAPYGPAHKDFAVRAGQGDGVRCLGVAGIATHGEGVGDDGVRARLNEERVALRRRR